MNLEKIVSTAIDKQNFLSVIDYLKFCRTFLEFLDKGLQATIISQNENHYRFFQYKEDGHFIITRPINSNLIYNFEEFQKKENSFLKFYKMFEI